jgi:trehalose-phosphatase
MTRPPLDGEPYRAVLFDLDGVVCDTASVHFRAWKETFDGFLARHGEAAAPGGDGAFTMADYRAYVDGRPRYDGVRTFLGARGISLPHGDPADAPGEGTVCALGNLKNDAFRRVLDRDGVVVFDSTVGLMDRLRGAGITIGLVTASRNAAHVLEATGLTGAFDVVVDGVVAAQKQLAGKPRPDTFVEAARGLGAEPRRCVVVEDATTGVEAGRRGGFGLVVGVDRHGGTAAELVAAGADVVVADLAALDPVAIAGDRDGVVRLRPSGRLPVADAREVVRIAGSRAIAVLLDYDGTLTPIVADPAAALLAPEARRVIERLAERHVVAVVSGRGLADVAAKVGIDRLYYAGSHGFELRGPDGTGHEHPEAAGHLPALERAARQLDEALAGIPGALVEPKRFGVAAHYRQVAPDAHESVRAIVRAIASEASGLRLTTGHMVLELRPDLPWDKGAAVRWLLAELGQDHGELLALFVGDDVTDEDAFRVIADRGVGIVVATEPRFTRATRRLDDPDAVRRFLDELASSPRGAT